MSAAVCPSCGVAVVPGYARCPKCRKPLPRRMSAQVEGGTALPDNRKLPVIAIAAAAVLGVAVIVWLGVRDGGDHNKKPAPAAPTDQQPVAAPAAAAPAAPNAPTTDTATAEQAALRASAELERALKKQRLWSTVNVVGGRVEVRSGSCDDPAMRPLLDAAAPSFKSAGLTKLRCVEQSGRVVSDRDL